MCVYKIKVKITIVFLPERDQGQVLMKFEATFLFNVQPDDFTFLSVLTSFAHRCVG